MSHDTDSASDSDSSLDTTSRLGSALSHWRKLELDDFVEAFESAWLSDDSHRLSILEVVDQADEELRPYLLAELVAVECECRVKAGETPSRREYFDKYPQWPEAVAAGLAFWQSASSDSAPATNPVPERIGDFLVLREIGRGGMGIVYEATQESLGRRVAIKTLASGLTLLPDRVSRFERESQAVAKLHHPNIADVYGTGIHEGVPYFAMKFIDGISLRDIIRAAKGQTESGKQTGAEKQVDSDKRIQPALSLDQPHDIANVGLQVARALQYAHQQGILHRDIKPSNLIVDDDAVAWVTDFGLAKFTEEQGSDTLTGDVIGTLRYLPPEALKGESSELADVYSLGVTLYELLALEPAFPESQPFELLERIREGEPPQRPSNLRTSQKSSDISPDLETVVMKAMASEPSARYQSAGDLAADLQRFLNGEPIQARQANIAERAWKWSRRKPVLASFYALIASVVFIGLPLLSFLWLRSEGALEQAKKMQIQLTAAKEQADASRETTEAEKEAAEVAEKQATSESYANSILLAQQYLKEGVVLEAYPLLAKWMPSANANASTELDRRGWEWHFIHSQLDSSRLTLTGHSGGGHVWDAAIRPDDQQIATVGGAGPARTQQVNPGEVILWDAKTGERQAVLPGRSTGAYGCAYSPDGKRIATISMRREATNGLPGLIEVWDVETHKLLNSVELHGTHDYLMIHHYQKPVLPGLRFSQDGKSLISWPQPVEVRDADTLELLWSDKKAHAGVDISDDRIFLSEPGWVTIADIRTGENSKRLNSNGTQFDLAFMPQREKISMASRTGIRVWDTSKLNFKDYRLDKTKLHWGMIHPNGKMFVNADRKGSLYFSTAKPGRTQEVRFRHLGHITGIHRGVFSHDRQWMVTPCADGTAKVWDTHSNNQKSLIATRASHERIADIAFAKNSTRIQYASRSCKGEEPFEYETSGWQNLKVNENRKDSSPADNPKPDSDTPDSDTPNNGATSSAAANSDTAAGLKRFDLGATYFANWPRTDFAFSPSGEFLAAPAMEDEFPSKVVGLAKSGRVNIYRSHNYELLGSIDVGMVAITSVQWSRDSECVAVSGVTRESVAPESVAPESVAPGQSGAKYVVKLYSAERFVSAESSASSSDAKIKKEKEAFEPLCQFSVDKPATAISWHGQTVAPQVTSQQTAQTVVSSTLATSHHNGIVIWDVAMGRGQASVTKRDFFASSRADDLSVFLDFSPDGKQLAAAVHDRRLARVYDVDNGKLAYEVGGPRAIGCVRFSPDGTRLAMAGYDSLVFLCDAKSGLQLMQLKGSEVSPGTNAINPRVVFSPNGRYLATNNWRGEITIWDAGDEGR